MSDEKDTRVFLVQEISSALSIISTQNRHLDLLFSSGRSLVVDRSLEALEIKKSRVRRLLDFFHHMNDDRRARTYLNKDVKEVLQCIEHLLSYYAFIEPEFGEASERAGMLHASCKKKETDLKNDFYQFWFMPQAILSLGIIVYDTTFMIQLLEDPEEDKTQDDIWYHLYSLYMERNHELSWICFTLELLNAETKVKHDLLCLVSKRYKIEGAYVRSRKDIPVFLDMLKKDERWEEALQSTFRDDMPPLYI